MNNIYYCFANCDRVAVACPFDALIAGEGPRPCDSKGLLYVIRVDNNVQTIIATIDITELLFEFARWCALQVIDLWDALVVVREYLETGDEALQVKGSMIANADIPSTNQVEYAASGAALRVIVTPTPQEAAFWAAVTAQSANPATEDAQRIKFQQMIDGVYE